MLPSPRSPRPRPSLGSCRLADLSPIDQAALLARARRIQDRLHAAGALTWPGGAPPPPQLAQLPAPEGGEPWAS